jgi:hypothetical protein
VEFVTKPAGHRCGRLELARPVQARAGGAEDMVASVSVALVASGLCSREAVFTTAGYCTPSLFRRGGLGGRMERSPGPEFGP